MYETKMAGKTAKLNYIWQAPLQQKLRIQSGKKTGLLPYEHWSREKVYKRQG